MSICFSLTDADWSLTKDVFSLIGTVVGALTGGAAIYFASAGLNTWRRQLRGTADHDLARRLLMELYRFRDAIQRARSPGIFSYEGLPFEGETVSADHQQASYDHSARAYRRRFSAMDEARNPLRATMLEAEAVWGDEVKALMEHVFCLEREFVNYVYLYLHSINPQTTVQASFARQNLLENRRNVMYDLGDSDDVYWIEMKRALLGVENHLRARLITK